MRFSHSLVRGLLQKASVRPCVERNRSQKKFDLSLRVLLDRPVESSEEPEPAILPANVVHRYQQRALRIQVTIDRLVEITKFGIPCQFGGGNRFREGKADHVKITDSEEGGTTIDEEIVQAFDPEIREKADHILEIEGDKIVELVTFFGTHRDIPDTVEVRPQHANQVPDIYRGDKAVGDHDGNAPDEHAVYDKRYGSDQVEHPQQQKRVHKE